MRAAILTLAIIGSATSGLLGLMWVGSAGSVREATKFAEELGLTDSAEVKAAVAKANAAVTAAYLLLLGMAVSAAAAVTVVKKPEWTLACGVVLIGCAVLPALFAAKSLVFTFFLVIAGGLCLKRATATKATNTYPKPLSATA